MTASSSTTPTPDPLALHPDGSALDPAAFRARLLGDPAAVADLAAADPAALAVLRSGADGPLQELLKAVYAEEKRRAEHQARTMSERTIDAQRASAPVPRDTVQLYQQLAASGLQYGPAFRLLRNVHVPEAEPEGAGA